MRFVKRLWKDLCLFFAEAVSSSGTNGRTVLACVALLTGIELAFGFRFADEIVVQAAAVLLYLWGCRWRGRATFWHRRALSEKSAKLDLLARAF